MSPILAARPISYSGGSTLMGFSDRYKDSVYYHYSPTFKYSLGIEAITEKQRDSDQAYARATYLLNRKNTRHSQRNLYLHSGLSSRGLDEHFYGVFGDWETRRWFTSFGYQHTKTRNGDYDDQFLQLGVAPYLGEYGDLHTWLMVKARKNTRHDGWAAYPVLKLFKGGFLVEFGYHPKAEWDIHLVQRF